MRPLEIERTETMLTPCPLEWKAVVNVGMIVEYLWRTKEQDVVIRPERHEHTRRLVYRRRLDVAQAACLPDRHLTVAHLAESSCRDVVTIAHPHHPGTLGQGLAYPSAPEKPLCAP